MWRKALCVLTAGLLSFSPPVGAQAEDPDVAKGIALVDEGDYDGAILTLDNAARRLSTEKAKAQDLSQAYLYLGIAYIGKGHDAAAKAKFREAIAQIKDLSLSPDKFPPKVIDIFEAAKDEESHKADSAATAAPRPPAATASSPAPAKKGGGGKALLIVGGLVAVGGGVALAAGGGSSSSAPTTTTTIPTRQSLSFTGTLGYEDHYTIVATKSGVLEAKAQWDNGQIKLNLGCADRNPPYTDCGGVYTRTSNTTATYTANVVQKEYEITIANLDGYPASQHYTLTVLFP
jgi:tetratricopeptide (TPR) repeat protein